MGILLRRRTDSGHLEVSRIDPTRKIWPFTEQIYALILPTPPSYIRAFC